MIQIPADAKTQQGDGPAAEILFSAAMTLEDWSLDL
jgi:hypothetical protein